jgi:hypothetical protein
MHTSSACASGVCSGSTRVSTPWPSQNDDRTALDGGGARLRAGCSAVASFWGLLPARGHSIVAAAGRRGRLTKGIAAHRDGSLCELDRTRVRGIPCTTAVRTLLDVAAVVPVPLLRRAMGEAEVLKVLDRRSLQELLSRNRGRRGVARLRRCLLELDPQTGRTRNELERSFLSLCVRAGLPPPQVNCLLEVGGRLVEPDFLWREAKLIVETDGLAVHGTAAASARDRRRDQQLMLDGWRVARFDWWQRRAGKTGYIRVFGPSVAATAGGLPREPPRPPPGHRSSFSGSPPAPRRRPCRAR